MTNEDLKYFMQQPWWPSEARISAGHAGHDFEICIFFDVYDFHPLIAEAVGDVLPGDWLVEDRETRIEVHPTGSFAGGYSSDDVDTVVKALPRIGVTVTSVSEA